MSSVLFYTSGLDDAETAVEKCLGELDGKYTVSYERGGIRKSIASCVNDLHDDLDILNGCVALAAPCRSLRGLLFPRGLYSYSHNASTRKIAELRTLSKALDMVTRKRPSLGLLKHAVNCRIWHYDLFVWSYEGRKDPSTPVPETLRHTEYEPVTNFIEIKPSTKTFGDLCREYPATDKDEAVAHKVWFHLYYPTLNSHFNFALHKLEYNTEEAEEYARSHTDKFTPRQRREVDRGIVWSSRAK